MTKPISLAHITQYYYPVHGGQEVYIEELIKALEGTGISSYVIQSFRGEDTPEYVLALKPVPLLSRLSRYISNLSWFLFNFRLYGVRREISKFDILVSHYSFHLPPIKWHRKVIVLSHGVLWSEHEQTLFNRTLKKRDFGLRKRRDNVVIVANDTDFLRRIGIEARPKQNLFQEIEKNVWFVPNCVDIGYFCPDPFVEREDIVLVPRNVRPDRGIHLAIEAFALFLKEHPSYKLAIAGGPVLGAYFERCKELISELGIEDKVVFLNFVAKDVLRDWYRKSAMTLVPSLEKEGTSLSALESMACGTPVVASQIGGLADLPCLLSAPEPSAFAGKMKVLTLQWEHFSLEQYRAVIKHYNTDKWKKTWIRIIQLNS